MSTEVPEGAPPGPGRRPGRSDGGAPVTGALTIVLAIVAVVAGFLILRAISDDDGGTTSAPTATDGTDTSIDPVTSADSTTSTSTTTTEPQLVTEGATVVVANANGVNGSAGGMSRELEAAGYTLGTATNADAATGQLPETVIYFRADNAAAQAVAESVGRSLGGVASISPVGTPAPVDGGDFDGDVLVVLGNDKAGATLAELADAAGTDDETTTVTSPEPSGGTESSTPG